MTEKEDKNEETIPFYPDHVSTEVRVMWALVAIAFIIGVIGVIAPVGLGEPADPLNTPEHAKPEWYFLFLYQVLKFVPKTVGATAPVIGVLILLIWPFIDKRPNTVQQQRIRIIVSIVLMTIIIALTIWGEVS
jgi:quinol-cytochrome oxidoreductase complex cytochrome b subunit